MLRIFTCASSTNTRCGILTVLSKPTVSGQLDGVVERLSAAMLRIFMCACSANTRCSILTVELGQLHNITNRTFPSAKQCQGSKEPIPRRPRSLGLAQRSPGYGHRSIERHVKQRGSPSSPKPAARQLVPGKWWTLVDLRLYQQFPLQSIGLDWVVGRQRSRPIGWNSLTAPPSWMARSRVPPSPMGVRRCCGAVAV